MTTVFRRLMLRPIMHGWVQAAIGGWMSVPHPRDTGGSVVDGPDPLRILLLGGGAAVGFGVQSHDLALPGHIAGDLSTTLGRGIRVDVVADVRMTVRRAIRQLEDVRLSRYDVVILMLGAVEGLELAPVERWIADYEELVADVLHRGTARVRVFAVETPTLTEVRGVVAPLVGIANEHSGELNRALVELGVQHPTVTVVPFTVKTPADAIGVDTHSGTYRAWAAQLTPVIARSISLASVQRSVDNSIDSLCQNEDQRQAALERLGILDTLPEERIDRIVVMAQQVFATASASVTFIDQDRQWFKSRRGIELSETPRSQSFCDHAIRTDEVFVVPNASADARFSDNPLVTGDPFIRFYAGYPIVTPDGFRVGTLCVYDPTPRLFSRTDRIMLRSFALMVQDEIWARQPAALTSGTD